MSDQHQKKPGRSWFTFGAIAAIVILLFTTMLYLAIGNKHAADPNWAQIPFRQLPGLVVAMVAGLFGASFSMLIQSHNRVAEGTLEDLSVAASWPTLLLRGLVGVGAATIFYFFFNSGLLEGNLWPELAQIGFDSLTDSAPRVVPNQHLCLLVIWCFLAGFSETLVPNLLASTERSSNQN